MNPKKQNNELEKWLPIEFNEAYEISDLGRLRHTYKNGLTKIIQPSTNGQIERDYLFLILDGKKHYIHQLVLYAFVGIKPLEHDCDHISGNRQDNRLSNLRYLHRSLNRSHKGEAHGRAKLTDKLVKMVRFMAGQGITQKQIAEIIEVSQITISRVITGQSWSHVL